MKKRSSTRVLICGRIGFLSDLIASTLVTAGFPVEVGSNDVTPSVVIVIEPHAGDWEVVRRLAVPFIVATATTSRLHESLEFITQGADALASVDTHQHELIHMVETVASGGSIFDPPILRSFMTFARTESKLETPEIGLSVRERQLLTSISEGHNIRESAHLMMVTTKTIENTQTRLFKKIGAKNRAAAARIVAANPSWIAGKE